ncbi:MAG: GNAT family N-acetyltransferase [Chloroflexi bacterium]|nr:GNAT family N-acetyltransferase [Chloroflexota bacterium]
MMSSFEFKPASTYSIPRIADLLTRSFEGYFLPIHITESVLLTMLRRDGIDLNESRVLLRAGEPIGIALIARRGWTSRLAAMGILTSERHGGAGTWAMQNLIEEARTRGEREMVLEVIEQNVAGVKLYQKAGFKMVRRLVGFKLEHPSAESSDALQEMDIREFAALVGRFGSNELPWQLSAATLSNYTPPARAFRLRDAACLITNPDVEHVAISSVLIRPDSREADSSSALLRTLFFQYPDKVWHVSAILPEEMSFIFDEVGMHREEITQWQMALTL